MRDLDSSSEPLTPALFHVLLALVDDEKHGYAILKDVERGTGGEVRLSTGTLYGIIKRLLAEGMIEESRRRPGPNEDSRRRYYRLTASGRAAAVTEVKRMEKAVALARGKRLSWRPARGPA